MEGPAKMLTLADVTTWAFSDPNDLEDPHNLDTLLRASDPVAVVEKALGGTLSDKDREILRAIVLNKAGDPREKSTLINGLPILMELQRLWLLTPRNSPYRSAKVDPWKGYT